MTRRRFVDLSISIETGLPSDPPMMIPKVDYIDHALGTASMLDFFPGLKKGTVARRGRMGRRIPHSGHPQRDASRCALSLPSHHGSGKTGDDH